LRKTWRRDEIHLMGRREEEEDDMIEDER